MLLVIVKMDRKIAGDHTNASELIWLQVDVEDGILASKTKATHAWFGVHIYLH